MVFLICVSSLQLPHPRPQRFLVASEISQPCFGLSLGCGSSRLFTNVSLSPSTVSHSLSLSLSLSVSVSTVAGVIILQVGCPGAASQPGCFWWGLSQLRCCREAMPMVGFIFSIVKVYFCVKTCVLTNLYWYDHRGLLSLDTCSLLHRHQLFEINWFFSKSS